MTTLLQPSIVGDHAKPYVVASSVPQYPSFLLGTFLHVFGVGVDMFMSSDTERRHSEIAPMPIMMCPSTDRASTYVYFCSSYSLLRFRLPVPFMHDEAFALDPNSLMETLTRLREMQLTEAVIVMEPSASNPYESFSVKAILPGHEVRPVGIIGKEFSYGGHKLSDYLPVMDLPIPENMRSRDAQPVRDWAGWGVANLSQLYDILVAREEAYRNNPEHRWAFYMEKFPQGLHVSERSYLRSTCEAKVTANLDGLLPWVSGYEPALQGERVHHCLLNLQILAPVVRLFRYDNVYLRIPKWDPTYQKSTVIPVSIVGRVGLSGSFVYSQVPLLHTKDGGEGLM